MIPSSVNSEAISVTIGEDNNSQTPKKLKQFLQFQLGTNISALLEAEIVKEILTISEAEILPVPEMSKAVIGIYSYRSEMVWVIDLENLLGYSSSSISHSGLNPENPSLMTMFVNFEGQSLGLVVSNIKGIVERYLQEIKPPSSDLFSQSIRSFIQGYFTSANQEMLILLRPEAIFSDQTIYNKD